MKKYIIPIVVFLVCTSKAYAALDITEIMYDPKGPNSGHQWVEVYNSGNTTVSIDDTWRFSDGSSHYMNAKKAFDVPASSYFILTGNKETFLSDHPSYAGLVIDTSMSLDKDGDTVTLLESGAVVAGVSYVASAGGSKDDKSLQKIDGSWVEAKPTPGAKNVIEAPIEEITAPVTPTQDAPTQAPSQTPPQVSIENATPSAPQSTQPAQTTPMSQPQVPAPATQTQIEAIPEPQQIAPTATLPAIETTTPTSEVTHTQTPATATVLTPDPPAMKKTSSKKKSKSTSYPNTDTTDQTSIDLSTMGAQASGAPTNVSVPILAGASATILAIGAAAYFLHKKKSVSEKNRIVDEEDLMLE